MGRFLAGAGSALLLMVAGFFLWSGQAGTETPPPPQADAVQAAAPAPAPPQATERTREERRFDRYDKDRDDRITRDEYLRTRRAAFARLDADGDGRLSFDEWAVRTIGKFDTADADRSGAMDRAEFATTRPPRRAPARGAVRCDCPAPAAAGEADD